MFSIKDWIQSAIKEFSCLEKKKKLLVFFRIKYQLALITCINVAVALRSHERGVTVGACTFLPNFCLS